MAKPPDSAATGLPPNLGAHILSPPEGPPSGYEQDPREGDLQWTWWGHVEFYNKSFPKLRHSSQGHEAVGGRWRGGGEVGVGVDRGWGGEGGEGWW